MNNFNFIQSCKSLTQLFPKDEFCDHAGHSSPLTPAQIYNKINDGFLSSNLHIVYDLQRLHPREFTIFLNTPKKIELLLRKLDSHFSRVEVHQYLLQNLNLDNREIANILFQHLVLNNESLMAVPLYLDSVAEQNVSTLKLSKDRMLRDLKYLTNVVYPLIQKLNENFKKDPEFITLASKTYTQIDDERMLDNLYRYVVNKKQATLQINKYLHKTKLDPQIKELVHLLRLEYALNDEILNTELISSFSSAASNPYVLPHIWKVAYALLDVDSSMPRLKELIEFFQSLNSVQPAPTVKKQELVYMTYLLERIMENLIENTLTHVTADPAMLHQIKEKKKFTMQLKKAFTSGNNVEFYSLQLLDILIDKGIIDIGKINKKLNSRLLNCNALEYYSAKEIELMLSLLSSCIEEVSPQSKVAHLFTEQGLEKLILDSQVPTAVKNISKQKI